MPLLIMLSLYFGLLICTLLFLKKTNRIKNRTKIKTKQKTIKKNHGNSNVRCRIK